ncbi:MAG: hypothetical protein WA130_08550 [Candidatus Methanoperedens sp.]
MDINEVREEVKKELISQRSRNEDSTIPFLCQKLGIGNEFDVITAIGDLEITGEIVLTGFKTVYREDGGAIHLAKYSGNTNQ